MTNSNHIGKGPGQALALVFALPEEARGVLKASDWQRVGSSASLATYQGELNGQPTILAISGVGRAPAEATTREVVEQHQPLAIVSLGFAGGLTEGGAAGDVVVAETLLAVDDTQPPTESLVSDDALVQAAGRVLEQKEISSRNGGCVTTSHIASDPEAKSLLREATGALAVEMESYWVARVCSDHNIPFLAVRAIVDTAEYTLPAFVAEFAFESGLNSRWRQALPVLFRPWWIPGLLRLGKTVSKARNSLTAFAMAFAESYNQEHVAGEPG